LPGLSYPKTGPVGVMRRRRAVENLEQFTEIRWRIGVTRTEVSVNLNEFVVAEFKAHVHIDFTEAPDTIGKEAPQQAKIQHTVVCSRW
jgi:hypothetical protein